MYTVSDIGIWIAVKYNSAGSEFGLMGVSHVSSTCTESIFSAHTYLPTLHFRRRMANSLNKKRKKRVYCTKPYYYINQKDFLSSPEKKMGGGICRKKC